MSLIENIEEIKKEIRTNPSNSFDIIKNNVPKYTMYQYVRECNKNNLNNFAFRFGRKRYTYGEFIELIDRYAKGFIGMGIGKGAKVSVNMNKEQLEDYIGTLKKELDINYMDLGEYYFHDDKIDENYDTKTEVAKIRNRAVEFKIKKNQKIIRFVAIKQFKNFLAKPEGKLRLGVITHITSKKKHK